MKQVIEGGRFKVSTHNKTWREISKEVNEKLKRFPARIDNQERRVSLSSGSLYGFICQYEVDYVKVTITEWQDWHVRDWLGKSLRHLVGA